VSSATLLVPISSSSNGECGDASKFSLLFELARVLVRVDHVARVIVNANHSIVRAAVKLSAYQFKCRLS
jgi:hypothetical protein